MLEYNSIPRSLSNRNVMYLREYYIDISAKKITRPAREDDQWVHSVIRGLIGVRPGLVRSHLWLTRSLGAVL